MRALEQTRAAMTVIRVAGNISWLSLRLASILGLGSERAKALEETFGELLALLRHGSSPVPRQ